MSDSDGAPRPPVQGLILHQTNGSKVPSGSAHPKAAMAGCFAMIFSAYNGTPAQPQPSRKGSSSERSSEG